MPATALHFLLLTVSGWVNRRQLAAIEYLREENRVLRAQLGPKPLKLNDAQRRALAEKGKLLGRKGLGELATIVRRTRSLDGIGSRSLPSTTGRRSGRREGRASRLCCKVRGRHGSAVG